MAAGPQCPPRDAALRAESNAEEPAQDHIHGDAEGLDNGQRVVGDLAQGSAKSGSSTSALSDNEGQPCVANRVRMAVCKASVHPERSNGSSWRALCRRMTRHECFSFGEMVMKRPCP